LDGEVKDGKVIEITPEKVKYKNPMNPGPVYSIAREKVLFVFNNSGGYCVIKANKETEEFTRFLQGANPHPSTDFIVTSDGRKIDCVIEGISNGKVDYLQKGAKGSIDQSMVLLLGYKSGQHKVVGNDYRQVAFALEKSESHITPIGTKAPTLTNIIQSEQPSNKKEISKNEQSIPVKGIEKVDNAINKPEPPPSLTAKTFSKKNETLPSELNVSFQEYEQKSLQIVKELNDYIKLLCDKATEYEKADKAIDLACRLFINEDATVSVSSASRQNATRYKIREYLKKLKLLRYGRVEIEWTHIQYVSSLRKGPDGNYYGVISFQQTFKGYRDNVLVYSDVTKKNVEVVLKAYKKSVEGTTTESWDVLLSDIGVIETKQS